MVSGDYCVADVIQRYVFRVMGDTINLHKLGMLLSYSKWKSAVQGSLFMIIYFFNEYSWETSKKPNSDTLAYKSN